MELSAKEYILKHVIEACDLGPIPDGKLPSEFYDDLDELGHYDTLNDELEYEFRVSGEETSLPCECSRHYESVQVARDLGDVAVSWTYRYGGGKHGEPDSIDWLNDAYFVKCEKVVKTVNVYTKENN